MAMRADPGGSRDDNGGPLAAEMRLQRVKVVGWWGSLRKSVMAAKAHTLGVRKMRVIGNESD
jgi:hypothetical protein